MTVARAAISFGRTARLTLTHARCDLRSTGGLHRFEALFTRPDFQAMALTDTANKLGHVFWTGTIGFGYSGGSNSAKYEFWIEDDQTSVPLILDQLCAVIEEAQGEEL